MSIEFGFNGTSTLDETAGLQGLLSADADNDVNVNTLPSDFSFRLFNAGELNLSDSFATGVGVAESPADLITVSADSNITSLSLTQANGDVGVRLKCLR